MTKLSDHGVGEGPLEECQRLAAAAFPVLDEAAEAVQPSECPLDGAKFGQYGEARRRGFLCLIRPSDDLDIDPLADQA